MDADHQGAQEEDVTGRNTKMVENRTPERHTAFREAAAIVCYRCAEKASRTFLKKHGYMHPVGPFGGVDWGESCLASAIWVVLDEEGVK